MVSLVRYNLKAANIYIFSFNQKENFVITNVNAIKRAERRAREYPSFR